MDTKLKKLSTKNIFIKNGNYLKEYKQHSLFDFKNFEFLKLGNEYHVIGSGGYGDVFLVKNKKDGKTRPTMCFLGLHPNAG